MIVEVNEDASFVLQGGMSATAIAFLQTTVLRMIPYALPSLFFIILDLVYGIKSAKSKKEKVRFSTAVRRTTTKAFQYVCWLVLSTTLALAFKADWLEWFILGLVYINEFASIVGNFLETKGMELSFVDFYRWVFRKASEKVGIAVEEAEAEGIIKEKQPRDKKGRFTKREDAK